MFWSLRQRGLSVSWVFSVACRNVGTFALRFSASGSPPVRAEKNARSGAFLAPYQALGAIFRMETDGCGQDARVPRG